MGLSENSMNFGVYNFQSLREKKIETRAKTSRLQINNRISRFLFLDSFFLLLFDHFLQRNAISGIHFYEIDTISFLTQIEINSFLVWAYRF